MLWLLGCHVFESVKVECYAGQPCASADQPPGTPEIAITPAAPVDDDPLVAEIVAEATDPDGQRVSYRYRWTRDGVEVPGLESRVPADETAPGEVWRVEVSAVAGGVSGEPADAVVEIFAPSAPPVISAVTLDPAAPGRNDDVTATVEASDPEGDDLTISYDWRANGVSLGAPDRPSLSATLHTPGDRLSVLVTVSDGPNTVEQLSAETARVDGVDLYRISHALLADVEQDRARMSGTWAFSFYTEGPTYGHLDCQAFYALASSRTRRCDTCDFSFSVQWEIDESQSALGPGCEGLLADPSAILEFFEAAPALYHNNYEARIDIDYRYYNGYYYTYGIFSYYPGAYAYDGRYSSSNGYLSYDHVTVSPYGVDTRWEVSSYSYNRL